MTQTCEGSAVLSYGASLQVQHPDTGSWLYVGGVTDFNGPNASRGEIDATTLCSTAKEYVMDLKDNGNFTSTMQTRMGDPAQKLMLAGLDSYLPRDLLNYRLVLPDDGFGNGEVWIGFKAWVQNFPISGAMGQIVTSALSLRITGEVTFTYPEAVAPRLTYSPATLAESASNGGAVVGIVSIALAGDEFADPLTGVSFSGLPAGLTAQVTRISNTALILNFSGLAGDTSKKAEVGVTFADAAFSQASAAQVSGATGKITINFV